MGDKFDDNVLIYQTKYNKINLINCHRFKHINDLNNWRILYCKKELAKKGIYQYKFKLHTGDKFGIGICYTSSIKPNMKVPGYGYNGIMYKFDGKLHIGTEDGEKYGDPFREGDAIGLELDLNKNKISFLKNDKSFGYAWDVPKEVFRVFIASQ